MARGASGAYEQRVAERPDPSRIQTFAPGASHPVDLKIGPGGDLFYADLEGGAIHRVRYTAANQRPVAAITAQPTSGPAPFTVQFDGAFETSFKDGDSLVTITGTALVMPRP